MNYFGQFLIHIVAFFFLLQSICCKFPRLKRVKNEEITDIIMGSIKGWEWPWDAQMVSTETEGAFADQSHGASYVCTQSLVSKLPLMEQTSESIGYGKYFVVVS